MRDRYLNIKKGYALWIGQWASLKSQLKNWRYFGVKLFGTIWDIKGLYEQNGILVIGTNVLFYI